MSYSSFRATSNTTAADDVLSAKSVEHSHGACIVDATEFDTDDAHGGSYAGGQPNADGAGQPDRWPGVHEPDELHGRPDADADDVGPHASTAATAARHGAGHDT